LRISKQFLKEWNNLHAVDEMGKIPYTPDLIVDENLSPGFVNELIKHGLKPLYIQTFAGA